MTFGIIFLVVSILATAAVEYFWLYPLSPWCLFAIIGLIPLFYLLSAFFTVLYILIGNCFIKKTVRTKPNKYAQWMIHETCTQICFLLGAHIKKTGMDKLPKDGNFILVCNHLSDFDQMVAIAALHKYPQIWITKPQNLDFPIVGHWLALAGYRPINREDPIEGVRTIHECAEFAKTTKYSVCVCPEGTRSKDHHLHPFHPGSFRLASLSEKPLVVLSLTNTWKIPHNIMKRITNVNFDVLKVFTAEESKTIKATELSEQSHQLIYDNLVEKIGAENA